MPSCLLYLQSSLLMHMFDIHEPFFLFVYLFDMTRFDQMSRELRPLLSEGLLQACSVGRKLSRFL